MSPKFRCTPLRLLIGGLMGSVCAVGATMGQAVPKPTDPPTLSLVTRDGVKAIGPTHWQFDFGTIDLLQTSQFEHVFTLRNDGKAPLTIDRVQSSCGCAVALLGTASNTQQTPHPTLAAGEEIPLRVTLDPTHLQAGPLHKTIWTYVQGHLPAAVTLELGGLLQSPISFSPPLLHFGRVLAGRSSTLRFTVAVDARLLPSDATPHLLCTNSHVTLTLLERETPGSPEGGRPRSVFSYTATLSEHADLGLVEGSVTLVLPPSATATAGTARRAPTTSGFPLPSSADAAGTLAGEVVGDIRASPTTVVFGVVTAGQCMTQSVALTAVSEAASRGLTVSCEKGYLSARLVAPEKSASVFPSLPIRLKLEVTLGEQAPKGDLHAEVIVTTAGGERLVLPVVAFVSGSRPPQYL